MFRPSATYTNVAGNINFLHSCVGLPQIENGVAYGTYTNPYAGLRYESAHPHSSPKKCFYAYLTTTKVSQCAIFSGSNIIWNRLIGVIDDTSLPSVFTANNQSSIISGANIQGKREWKSLYTSIDDSHKSCYIPVSFKIGNQYYIGMYFFPMIHTGTGQQSTTNPTYYNQIWFYKEDGTYTVGYSDGSYQLTDTEVDFGSLQKIPEYFYNWIMSNSDEAKTAKIIIKEGNTTLAESPMIPPYTSISLATVGNRTTLTTNNGDELTFDTKDNFSGLSESEIALYPTIRVGTLTYFANTGEVTFYTCYKPSRPLPNNFLCSFYRCDAEENRVDKTDYLSDKQDFYITLKDEAPILGMSIFLDLTNINMNWDIPKWNYCYLHKFNRWYFCELKSVYNNVWEFKLSEDVLMSFKDQISGLQGMVERNQTIFDRDIPDDLILTKAYPVIEHSELSPLQDIFKPDDEMNDYFNYLIILRG